MTSDVNQTSGQRNWLVFFAWFSILMVSDLPDIIFKYSSGQVPSWLFFGKSMVETKGFLWPWLIHFLPDVMIFISYAMIWIKQV
jgi:hypothetical protein